MEDQTSAFTYDDGFFASTTIGESLITAAVDPVGLPNDLIIKGDEWISDNIIDYHGSEIIGKTYDEDSSAEANVQGVNPHYETLADSMSCQKLDFDNAAHREVPAPSIESESSDQWKAAEPDPVTSQASTTENIDSQDLELETSQKPIHTPAFEKCLRNAPAHSEDATLETVASACKAAQDTQSEAQKGDPAPDVGRPSSRPSRDVHPIGNSSPGVSVEPRSIRPLQPSRDVQPIRSQRCAVAIIVRTDRRPQNVSTRVDPSMSEESWSESSLVSRCESRKRMAEKDTSETVKRVKQSDKGILLVCMKA